MTRGGEPMSIGFEDLSKHAISMNDFGLKWRFIEEKYNKLPNQHLEQLKPLDDEAARFLWDYIVMTNLHHEIPFQTEFFQKIDKAKILDTNQKEIKKWLYQRGIAFDKPVFLSWNPTEAMIVPWKLFIKYFDSFYYSGADDLTIIDQSLHWALLFYHEDEIYFGTKQAFTPSEMFADIDFIW